MDIPGNDNEDTSCTSKAKATRLGSEFSIPSRHRYTRAWQPPTFCTRNITSSLRYTPNFLHVHLFLITSFSASTSTSIGIWHCGTHLVINKSKIDSRRLITYLVIIGEAIDRRGQRVSKDCQDLQSFESDESCIVSSTVT